MCSPVGTFHFTFPLNSTGQPAISLALPQGSDGFPIGIQLVARYGRQDLLTHRVMSLASGARCDLVGARRGRDAQDEEVAAGFFGVSVPWAELGIALAAAAHGDVEEARAHAEAGRSWEQGAGLVASEVYVILTVIDAVAGAKTAITSGRGS